MDRSRRIYVAGHRGLVGSAICRRLRQDGYSNLIVRDRQELDLFDRPAVDRIDHTLDALRERFGRDAIRRGTGEGLHDLDWRGDDLRR